MNFLKWMILILLVAAGLSLLLWYFKVEPVFGFVDGIVSPLAAAIMTFDISKITAQAAAGYASIAALATGTFGFAYKWIKERAASLFAQKQAIASEANLQTVQTEYNNVLQQKDAALSAVVSEKEALTAKITELESNATGTVQKLEDAQKQITTLEAAKQALIDQNTNFVRSGQQAANGALIYNEVDGKTYSVLKFPPEVYVK